ncbi:phosphotransferase [Deinococcus radiotolerans]|nr:phosphotransferase [Deinococcus radiotolerans]
MRGGGTLARLGDRWGALFEVVVPGATVPRHALSPEHAAGLGALLAAFHTRLPGAVPFEVPPLVPAAGVAVTLDRLRVIETAILALPHPDATDGWALDRTRQRLAHLRTSPLPEDLPTLPLRFVHGDFHDGNVFFQAGVPAAVIDWEQPRLAPRAWEVVRALHLSLRLDPALGGAFLRAYREHLPLPPEELRLGADLYAALQERNMWVYESVYLRGNPGPRAFIRPPPYVPFPQAWTASGLR